MGHYRPLLGDSKTRLAKHHVSVESPHPIHDAHIVLESVQMSHNASVVLVPRQFSEHAFSIYVAVNIDEVFFVFNRYVASSVFEP
jgi:hypothetical protein